MAKLTTLAVDELSSDKGPCRNCDGLGHVDCRNCRGTGRLESDPRYECPYCEGGRQICLYCNGSGRQQ